MNTILNTEVIPVGYERDSATSGAVIYAPARYSLVADDISQYIEVYKNEKRSNTLVNSNSNPLF